MTDPFEYLNRDSKWVSIPEGGSYTGVYLGAEIGEKFRGKDTLNYKFQGDKTLSSGSKRLASRMRNIKKGQEITIKKFGSGMDTVYEVEVVGSRENISNLTNQKGQEW